MSMNVPIKSVAKEWEAQSLNSLSSLLLWVHNTRKLDLKYRVETKMVFYFRENHPNISFLAKFSRKSPTSFPFRKNLPKSHGIKIFFVHRIVSPKTFVKMQHLFLWNFSRKTENENFRFNPNCREEGPNRSSSIMRFFLAGCNGQKN